MTAPEEQLTPRRILIRSLAEKRGVSEAAAEAIMAAVDRQNEADEFRAFMGNVKDNAAILKQLDPVTQQQALGYMASASVRGGGDDMDSLRKMLREITVIREAMRGDTPMQDNAALQGKLDELTKKIEEMKTEEDRGRMADLEKTVKDTVEKLQTDMKERLATLAPGTPADEKSAILKTLEDVKAWRATEKELQDAFGAKAQPASPEQSITAALEEAKKLGYGITPPRTLDDIEKNVKEQVEKARLNAIEETTKKLKSDDKKMALLISLGQAALDGFLPALTQGSGGAETLKAAKEALKSVPPET